MNILLLSSEYAPARGGVGTYAREIAMAATNLGACVTVVAPDYAQDTTADDRDVPFVVRRFHGGLHSARDLPAKILLARSNIGGDSFDIVHAADWPFFIPVALLRWRTTARLLMTVHGTEINETQTTLKRLSIHYSGAFGPRTEIAANSHYTRDLFRQKFVIDDRRLHAILLGVSEFWFGLKKSRDATRAAYDIPSNRIVIVTVARITRRKGHLLMLAALARQPEDLRKRLTWLVIGPDGESDFVDEVRRIAESSDCDVRLFGSLSNEHIRDIYGAADFFGLTGAPDSSGRVEGFGLVYLEAGASGLPSVATAIGGVPDAVIADQTGLLTAPSVEQVAAAITKLAVDTDLRSTLADGATAHARHLSWERCAAETYRLQRPSVDASMPDVHPIQAAARKITG